MRRTRRARIALVLVGAAFAVATPDEAFAQRTKQECARAAESAQAQTQEGKLTSARASLILCSSEACPATVRAYCARWLEEAEASLPSLVVKVHDESGGDLTTASVAIDGKPVPRWIDGLPVTLDPGSHVVDVTNEGSAPQRVRLLIVAGEKNRRVVLTVATPRPAVRATPEPAPATPPSPPPTPDAWDPGTSRRAAGYIVGAVGVVSLGVGSYFGIKAFGYWRESNRACVNEICTDAGAYAARQASTSANIADVALGMAAVGLATGTYLVLTAPKATASKAVAKPQVVVGVTPTATGARLFAIGSF